jgi:hypothetical protein
VPAQLSYIIKFQNNTYEDIDNGLKAGRFGQVRGTFLHTSSLVTSQLVHSIGCALSDEALKTPVSPKF